MKCTSHSVPLKEVGGNYLHGRLNLLASPKDPVSKHLFLGPTFLDSLHPFIYSGEKVLPEWKFGPLN